MIVMNVIYETKDNSVLDYVKEVKEIGLQESIKQEAGCLNYEYYSSLDHPNKVFLLEQWENDEVLFKHSESENMKKLKEIKNKYNVTTSINKFFVN